MSRLRVMCCRVPKDDFPPLGDTRWALWSKPLRVLIENNPTTWNELRGLAILQHTTLMGVRNLLGYLEEVGYAVSFVSRGKVVLCGCVKGCAKPRKGCPKESLDVKEG